jgi:flagellum-specific peptidoglycan hydrolase FlgJ
MSYDFMALKRLNAAVRDVHEQAVLNMYKLCKAENKEKWVTEFVNSALIVLRPTRVPVSPAMGQGLLESNYGKSKSLFGIKARKSDIEKGLAFESLTKEFVHGNWISCPAYFYKDNSMLSEFQHYLDLMRRMHPEYKNFYPKNYDGYLKYIVETNAYATDPDYVSKIEGVIMSCGLKVFDDFSIYKNG